ncbi:MAG: NAD(P)H-hydrate epimerase [Candidatus Omnitrophota bacterium]
MRKNRIPVLSAKRLRSIDEAARAKFGIPTLVLMENAGRAVYEEAARRLKNKKRRRVVLFCGAGNNGGDGFVCARHLFNNGIPVTVYLLGKKSKIKGAAGKNLEILEKLGIIPVKVYKSSFNKIAPDIRKSDLVIDAIFGVGLDRDVKQPHKGIIDLINASKKPVVAIDISSGLDSDKGLIRGSAIKAGITVTFQAMKKGMRLKNGPAYSGRIKVADISIPKALL